MAIRKKTTPREMKLRMIIFSVLFFVMMAITSWLGVPGTGMIFLGFGVIAALLAIYWARREARERQDG